jgi:hypothetical protein
VAALDLRWCLSPRDGRFFGDRGDHKLSCSHDLWHSLLECWVPGRDPEIDFTGGKRQDATAEHLGSLCTAGALQQEAEREEIARTEADLVRVTTHIFRLAAVLSVWAQTSFATLTTAVLRREKWTLLSLRAPKLGKHYGRWIHQGGLYLSCCQLECRQGRL